MTLAYIIGAECLEPQTTFTHQPACPSACIWCHMCKTHPPPAALPAWDALLIDRTHLHPSIRLSLTHPLVCLYVLLAAGKKQLTEESARMLLLLLSLPQSRQQSLEPTKAQVG